MKILLDFFPIVLFFIVYKTVGLYMAIYTMMGATALQVIFVHLQTGKFEKTHLVAFGLLVVLGGVTLTLRDPAFLMWKVSVLYVVFAVIFLSSMWIGNKTLLERMLGKELSLSAKVWRQLTWFWGIGFIGIAIVNSYYVNLALAARSALFSASSIDPKIELTELNCKITTVEILCDIAQKTEESWVNFKLFGTMGLTFLLLFVTMIFIYKYLKKNSA